MDVKDVHDSSGEDSDYLPDTPSLSTNSTDTAEDGDEEDDKDAEIVETIGSGIRPKQRDAMDAMWEEMNAEVALPTQSRLTVKNGGSKKKRKAIKKANKVLAGIFGKKTASSMMVRVGNTKVTALQGGGKEDLGGTRALALAAHRKVEVAEVKKFAGREITVKRTVTAAVADKIPSTVAAASKSSGKGLDGVLAALDGPKNISTVAKSSMDWDNYKAQEGLEGEMEQVTKEGTGYLNKQDFLQRCDVRRFEQERDARAAKRDLA